MNVVRTNSSNKDFVTLVQKLDTYLKITDGDEHDFYHQFNGINVLHNVVVVYVDKIAVGCGAFKPFENKSVEIKRMYVSPEFRGTKVAATILLALEKWAKELNYERCILETGKRMISAVKFYEKSNYKQIPNYGQYVAIENSVCFEKII